VPGEAEWTKLERIATFAQHVLFDAAEKLCKLRLSRSPAAGTAETHWFFAAHLFKALIATTAFLKDLDACHRAIGLVKLFGAAVGIRG